MRRWTALIWICILATLPLWGQDTGLPQRPDPPRLVNDLGGIFSAEQRANLEAKLVAYDDSTSTQIMIITVPNLGAWEISEFAYSIGDAWGVGQADLDNGLVIAVAVEDRKVFLATGRGLEGALPDALCGRIVRNIIVPSFKEGDYYAGIDRAVDAAILTIGGEFVRELKEPEVPVVPIVIIVLLFMIIIITISSLIYKYGGQINSEGWDGTVITPGRSGRHRGIGGFGGFGGGGGGFGGGGGGFGGFGGGGFGGGGAGGSW